ncbi:MAG: hemolysin III family protein [Jiangellales bacterium]
MVALASHAGAAVVERPRMRGVLHAYAAPIAAAVGIGVLALADDARSRTGVAVWVMSMTALFAVSATYHRGRWRPAVRAWLQRVDHSMIFVFIAGSYTPFCLLLLEGSKSWLVLSITWGGALAGVATRLVWHTAPRWLFGPMYIALGWVAVVVLPDLVRSAPVYTNVLLLIGGLLYTLGAVVFATRRPDPVPHVFGYHEVFHALTVIAASCHAVAITGAVLHA